MDRVARARGREAARERLDTGVEPGDVNLYGISYGDPDHAWLVGEFGVVMTSTDGGLTWPQQAAPVESTLFGVRFIDAKRGLGRRTRFRHPAAPRMAGATWHRRSVSGRRAAPSSTSPCGASRAGSSATPGRC